MKIKKIIAVTGGLLMLTANMAPVFACTESRIHTDPMIQNCQSEINSTANLIYECIDDITIEKEVTKEEQTFSNDVTCIYFEEEPTYNYVYEQQTDTTLTVDEFMALYGNDAFSITTNTEEEAYELALSKYNTALYEYEEACRLIENPTEVEVEIIEEVTDEEGNSIEVTRSEIQTIVEIIPNGDVDAAQANLDAAKAELDSAQYALETAQSNTSTETISATEESSDFNFVQETNVEIDEYASVAEEVTYSSSGTCGENLTWVLTDRGLLTISGTGDMYDYGEYDTAPWGNDIVSVKINSGLTSIGMYAFSYCHNLTDIVIPDTVTRISERAFYSCSNLQTITLSENLTGIDDFGFSSCSSLTSIVIPDKVETIGEGTFSGCKNLKTIEIPDNVNNIGSRAFYETPFLNNQNSFVILGNGVLYQYKGSATQVVIPDGVINIADSAFQSKNKITSITIPDGVLRIGEYAFNSCTRLTNVSIPDSVTQIEKNAFSQTSFLDNYEDDFMILGDGILYKYKGSDTEVIVPDGVKTIGHYAFTSCTNITKITLPDTVTVINDGAFSNCTSLNSIFIPDTVTTIGASAFSKCTALSSIHIPNSVAYLGKKAFEECKKLESFIIPENVKCIEDYLFHNSGLTAVTIPNGVTSIGDYAFYECYSLNEINFPKSITYIGEDAFDQCWSLKSIIIPNGVASIKDRTFFACGSLTSITIPYGISCIEAGAFAYCSSLKEVVLPRSVTKIGNAAFSCCYSLESISIPDTVTRICGNSFDQTPFLESHTEDFVVLGKNVLIKYNGTETEITIPGNIKYIGDYAFGIYDVTKVIIPNGVLEIGVEAFSGVTDIVIPHSVVRIEDRAFEYATFESLDIPDSVTNIGSSAFSNCARLTGITIPDSITRIEKFTFYDCKSMTSITIPSSVTYIGDDAFYFCDNLTDVYYKGTERDWNTKNLYEFNNNVTIHFLEQDFPFLDVPEDAWYYSTVKECYETGLISGTSATTFSPMQAMTRAMVVTILWRMEGQPKVAFNDKFSDVSSKQWYANSVSWAEQAGVVHGYGDGTFKPDAAVTREQVAVMLANYAQYKGVYTPGTKDITTYPDGNQVSSWAVKGMKWAVTEGIITGNGAGYLNPKKSATRAEGAAMLLRMKHWMN